MNKLSQLVLESEFLTIWSGKRGSMMWDGRQVNNQSSRLIKLKENGVDSKLSIKDIALISQFEPSLLIEILETQGMEIKYQKHLVNIAISGKTIHISFTQINNGTTEIMKVTHRQALNELKSVNVNNDFLEIIQRLYQLIKDNPNA